jgi:hypothetical protein
MLAELQRPVSMPVFRASAPMVIVVQEGSAWVSDQQGEPQIEGTKRG